MLGRIDDYLIDHIAQPVADRLVDRITPSKIAGFLFAGSIVMLIAEIYGRYLNAKSTSFIWINGLVLTWLCWRWFDAERRSERISMTMPRERIQDKFLRCFLFFSFPVFVFLCVSIYILDGGALIQIFSAMQQVLEIAALYFMACRVNPPKEKRATQFSRQYANAGAS